jgi:hypothetical protein
MSNNGDYRQKRDAAELALKVLESTMVELSRAKLT